MGHRRVRRRRWQEKAAPGGRDIRITPTLTIPPQSRVRHTGDGGGLDTRPPRDPTGAIYDPGSPLYGVERLFGLHTLPPPITTRRVVLDTGMSPHRRVQRHRLWRTGPTPTTGHPQPGALHDPERRPRHRLEGLLRRVRPGCARPRTACSRAVARRVPGASRATRASSRANSRTGTASSTPPPRRSACSGQATRHRAWRSTTRSRSASRRWATSRQARNDRSMPRDSPESGLRLG